MGEPAREIGSTTRPGTARIAAVQKARNRGNGRCGTSDLPRRLADRSQVEFTFSKLGSGRIAHHKETQNERQA